MLRTVGQVVAVLAIVGVVAAMVLPTVYYRRGSRIDPCESSEKQIGLALFAYQEDFDNRLPPPYRGGVQGWAGRVNPYVKNPKLFRCAAEELKSHVSFLPSRWVGGDATPDRPPAVAVSYGYNANLRSGASGFATPDATAPASTVMLFEVQGAQAEVSAEDEGTQGFTTTPASKCLSPASNGSGTVPQWGWLGSGPSPLRYATGPIGGRTSIVVEARHTGGANYVALDGHVRWLKPEQVSGGATNPSPMGKQDEPPRAAAGTLAGCVLTFSPM